MEFSPWYLVVVFFITVVINEGGPLNKRRHGSTLVKQTEKAGKYW